MGLCTRHSGLTASTFGWCRWLGFVAVAVCLAACGRDPELEWRQDEGYSWAALTPGQGAESGFQELRASRTSIDFTNHLTDEHIAENRNLLNGSGVAAGDVDGDGLVDLYFAQLDGPNRLYRNLGQLEFEDITDRAGVAHEGFHSTGVVLEDVDGDGDLDLLVTSLSGENVLYLNDGDGGFTQNADSGLGPADGSATMTLADIDDDGDLDLYITNYKEKSVQDIYPFTEIAWENTVKQEGGHHVVVPPYDEHFVVIAGRHGPDRRELGTVDELYINQGDGTFDRARNLGERFLDENGEALGLERDFGLTARFQDLNDDRRPDLYVCNDFWTPDRVWLNLGKGRFQAADARAIRSFSFSSMAVAFSDINRDGATDFFVSEMLSPEHETRLRQVVSYSPFVREAVKSDAQPQYMRNTMYAGRGDGTFAEIAHFAGVEASGWSWATEFLDVDLDGFEDLLINTGHAYDVLDIDTQERLAQVMSRRGREQKGYILQYPTLHLRNVAYRNNGDWTFTDASALWGLTGEDVSHGMALADLDNDGDLDVVVNRLNGTAGIFRNGTSAPRIAVRLKGRSPNTSGVGARIELRGGPVTQHKEVVSGGGYLSGSDPMVVFAADAAQSNHILSVRWPDGSHSVIDGVRADRIYEIEEPASPVSSDADTVTYAGASGRGDQASDSRPSDRGDQASDSRLSDRVGQATDSPSSDHPGQASDSPPSDHIGPSTESPDPGEGHRTPAPIFEDVSETLDHRHRQSDFNDFRMQPLLPASLSRVGPGVAWMDLDGDGDDDLLVGAGPGGSAGSFENLGAGRFAETSLGPLGTEAGSGHAALIGWEEAGKTRVLVGQSSYVPRSSDVAARDFSMGGGRGVVERSPIPGSASSTGPLAAADYDMDGDLDLFVGGRVVPGQYPADADSRLFKQEEDGWRLDEGNAALLERIGLVTDAVFVDVDLDGDQDLICSTEWGPVRVFRNTDGRFEDVTELVGLDAYRGWWNGIATGDFNNDGRPDLVATNLGANSVYQRHLDHPLRLYFGDFSGGGGIDLLETYYDDEIGGYVPRRGLYELHNAIQTITSNLESHRQFASSTIEEILGRHEDDLSFKSINTLEHVVFMNSEDGFEAHPLPTKAQWSAAFFAGVADFDNDGNEDIFITQNLFAVPPLTPRLDAGRGLWIRGLGSGRFEAVEGDASGIKVYGEQRGAALGDFDVDGRVDLAVSQNDGQTKLYRNRTPREGIRIRLRGPEENRSGIGSSIRLVYENGGRGPRRMVQTGSGYLSQNSATQIMGMAERPESIEVVWFDGTTQIVDVSGDEATYEIEYLGRSIEDGGGSIEDDGRNIEDDGRNIEDGGRSIEDDGRNIEDGGRST